MTNINEYGPTIVCISQSEVNLGVMVLMVCVSVCLQGETAVASATNCPDWNEEISFIEQFPPLAQRIRVQILDDAKMGDVALATHFLDLQQISDPTRNGTATSFYLPENAEKTWVT